MTRFLPRLRGWVAIIPAMIASFLFPGILPPRYSTLGDWRFRCPVPLWAHIAGGVLVVLCVAACFEAFRRGSRADRVAACVGVYFTLCLFSSFLKSFFYGIGN